MNAIDRYNRAKADLAEATAFVAMLDAPSNGKFVDLVFYSSIKDKSGNTAKMPAVMREEVEDAAKTKADNIYRAALVKMQADLVTIANEAKIEYAQIAADAGVTVP